MKQNSSVTKVTVTVTSSTYQHNHSYFNRKCVLGREKDQMPKWAKATVRKPSCLPLYQLHTHSWWWLRIFSHFSLGYRQNCRNINHFCKNCVKSVKQAKKNSAFYVLYESFISPHNYSDRVSAEQKAERTFLVQRKLLVHVSISMNEEIRREKAPAGAGDNTAGLTNAEQYHQVSVHHAIACGKHVIGSSQDTTYNAVH